MNIPKSIFVCVAALLSACGSDSRDNPSDEHINWQYDTFEYMGFTSYGLSAIGHSIGMDPRPSPDVLDETEEGYFEVEFDCTPAFDSKYLDPDLWYEDMADVVESEIAFDRQKTIKVILDDTLGEFEYDEPDHRQVFAGFLTSEDEVQILIEDRLAIIPMGGFAKAHAQLPEECQFDKTFSMETLSKVDENRAVRDKRIKDKTFKEFKEVSQALFPDAAELQYRNGQYYSGILCADISDDGESWKSLVFNNRIIQANDDMYKTYQSLCSYGDAVIIENP